MTARWLNAEWAPVHSAVVHGDPWQAGRHGSLQNCLPVGLLPPQKWIGQVVRVSNFIASVSELDRGGCCRNQADHFWLFLSPPLPRGSRPPRSSSARCSSHLRCSEAARLAGSLSRKPTGRFSSATLTWHASSSAAGPLRRLASPVQLSPSPSPPWHTWQQQTRQQWQLLRLGGHRTKEAGSELLVGVVGSEHRSSSS